MEINKRQRERKLKLRHTGMRRKKMQKRSKKPLFSVGMHCLGISKNL